jgi:hypothetical protein
MKITYLLGAGASCGVLPVIVGLKDRFAYLSKNLESDLLHMHKGTKMLPSDKGWFRILQEEFAKYAALLEEESSIDTYAKILFINNKLDELNDLKAVLSAYFIIEMILNNGKCDKRYRNFWANIIENSATELPDNVKILSWNYDSQIEQSYLGLVQNLTLHSVNEALNICDGKPPTNGERDSFSIYKINGTASFLMGENSTHIIENYKDGNSFANLSALIDFLEHSSLNKQSASQNTTTLTYAFETMSDKNNRKEFISHISEALSDTEILVIIGYSFPSFNKDIDKLLFKNSDITTVYVQDPKAENIIKSAQAILGDLKFLNEIKYYAVPTNDMQFYIPDEFR